MYKIISNLPNSFIQRINVIFHIHHKCVFHQQVGVGVSGKYKIVLDSDAEEFGGHKLIDHSTDYFTSNEAFNNRPHSLMVSVLYWK